MSSREISLWIDKRWYEALNKHLKDETVEEHLEEVLDQMCNQLPEGEYERISSLIWQERQGVSTFEPINFDFRIAFQPVISMHK